MNIVFNGQFKSPGALQASPKKRGQQRPYYRRRDNRDAYYRRGETIEIPTTEEWTTEL